ncbi:MAG TPA: alkyl sulfatase dimerization domain-containing protein [Acidimicrobiales bacterium]
MGTAPKEATTHTRARNVPLDLGFDPADFDRASRGLVAQHPTGIIDSPVGVVWDVNRYDFIEQGSANPDTVHPSLWRQAQLNAIHGLFEVAPGLWQARGYDISNISFVAGDTGWIVIDPLTAAPCARACLDLANTHLGERPVVAVIYTHSHADHFGGVLGVTSREDVEAGRCRVIAPEHFMRETVGENVIAGYAMVRRAIYQFGPLLPAGPRQHVDCGLGKAIPFWGPDLLAPTEEITHTATELLVDGVRIVFQLTPEAEAPSEMNFWFPDKRWLCTAENCTHNMHNLVPIRGALVRDALKWSKYIGEILDLVGDEVELSFASHHWPRWGNDDVKGYLQRQRDLYRWLHDQTMRLANHGHTAVEIAEMLTLPPEFAAEAHTTGYYGHLAHNIKAVVQRYLSWYDGNPANLWRLPPVDAGRRYVDLAGGPDALLAKARVAFDAGDYRWAVELVNHLVFADPADIEARELQADALEQLGYQSESATFRNAFLTGAQELRNGTLPPRPAKKGSLLTAMSPDQMFDAVGVRLKADEVGGQAVTVNITLIDLGEDWVLRLSNRALHASAGRHDSTAPLALRLSKPTLHSIFEGELMLADAVAAGNAEADGDIGVVAAILDHLDTFMTNFPIVEP